MRQRVHQQARLVPAIIEHEHAEELKRINALLDQMPRAVELVHADLVHPRTKRLGRKGTPAEQILRAMLVKQMNGFSYEQLAFHLADSSCYRWFCRMGIGDRPPKKSSLQKSIKRVRAETWSAINIMVIQSAIAAGVETGERIRTDCTAIESDIHDPTDSALLWDSVRVLARVMEKARDEFGISFNDRRRRAKRRMVAILSAKRMERRIPLYRDLLKVTEETVEQAKRAAERLDGVKVTDRVQMLRAMAIATELRHYVDLAARVMDQTKRRVLAGESVPASDKIVSIFEPHTDIIVKDNRGAVYGHKVIPAAKAPFPLSIERTDEVVDLSSSQISWARVWKGSTKKGTRIALMVCSIAVENEDTPAALANPGISGDLERCLAASVGGSVDDPCDIKDDFEADDLKDL